MSTQSPLRAVLTVAIALAAGTFVACAPPRTATTSITSAEASSDGDSPTLSPALAAPRESVMGGSAGQLVCRTTSPVDGTSELFLEWSGAEAKGFLRRVAPSGMAYMQPVRGERVKGAIVIDDPAETDLVAHAAVVTEERGTKRMQLGDGNHSWIACE